MRKLIVKPYVYLSLIALILAILLPFPFEQYKITPYFKVFNTKRLKRAYCDFNKDGVSEFIRLHQSGNLSNSAMRIIVTDFGGNLIFRSELPEYAGGYNFEDDFILDDLYDSGYKSAGIFTRSLDSLYLSVFHYADTSLILLAEPLFAINQSVEQVFTMKWLGRYVNEKNEIILYFYMDESVSMNGVTVFKYNLSSKEISSLRLETVNPELFFVKSEYSEPQIILNSVSNNALSDDYAWEYSEVEARLILLNMDLEFLREPIVLAPRYAYADVEIIEDEDNNNFSIFTYLWNFGEVDKSPTLLKFNSEGDRMYSAMLPADKSFESLALIRHQNSKDLYLVSNNNEYYLVDPASGDISRPVNARICLDGLEYITSTQLDRSEAPEYVFFDYETNELVILRNNYNHAAKYEVMDENFDFSKFDVRMGNSFQVVLPGEVYFNRLNYQTTTWVWLKYPAWLLVIFLLNLFIWLRSQLKQKRQLRIKAIERKITDLQLKNFRNQLDPHFTFNALNVIGSVIYKEDKDVAYDYFTRFTRLMRTSLADSTKATRELKAELQFTTDYLEFQRYRFKDKFDFYIHVDDDIDQSMAMPKMLIQGYAENAVRHAFNQIDYKGRIDIEINKLAKDGIVIIVRDNGIGRAAAAAKNKKEVREGRGMNVMEEQIRLFNNYNHKDIKIEIIDLTENDKPAGTEIKILIPKLYSFTISKK